MTRSEMLRVSDGGVIYIVGFIRWEDGRCCRGATWSIDGAPRRVQAERQELTSTAGAGASSAT